ncbi:protein NUCLEAR FUSION DEFECTIVE 4-like [Dendrobium catenatum]|uniref:protein NUCLEAR FUSION DEFECTIVE 4-like n=1 Tax=Dendrobium catenatum TaxID=906689 RepID=UPI0009F25C74|nr:protein NUCLEAR FUSION DEFECTIVE 4-like [Dendrobium catenatum]
MSVLPWLTVTTVIWLQAIGGTNTDFSAYSSPLKSRLGITQVKLNNLAFASDAGKLFGWCAGLAASRLPLCAVLAIGVTLSAIGYGLQFLFMSRIISSLSYTQFFFLNMLNGNSICWLNTVAYITIMRQFLPADHGTVIALTTSYTGLTAKIYLALAEVIVGKNNAASSGSDGKIYVLLNAVTPVVIALLTMPTIWAMREKPRDVKAGLVMMFGIAGVTGAYAVIQTTVPTLHSSSGIMPEMVLVVMVAAVILVPVVKVGEWAVRRGKQEGSLKVGVGEVGDVEGGTEEEKEEEEAVVVVGTEGNVKGVVELVKKVNFWLYFMVYLCGATLGLVYGNNLGQISQSRGVSEIVLLSVYSSFGFFGRLATAPLSIFSRSRYKISKIGTIAVLMIFMSISFFLLISSRKVPLLVSTAIIGSCSGAITSIAVSVSSELFGQENFGVNHNIVISNIPVGSFLFGSIAALIYDKGENVGTGRDRICIGSDCYQKTFIIWGCICSFGTILSFVLFSRTRKSFIKS